MAGGCGDGGDWGGVTRGGLLSLFLLAVSVDKDLEREEFFSLGLGVQGVVASLGLPSLAADVAERAVAEVSPENLSETRVTAVTGW